jgi:uncharacterized coiled-coil protein SlyX
MLTFLFYVLAGFIGAITFAVLGHFTDSNRPKSRLRVELKQDLEEMEKRLMASQADIVTQLNKVVVEIRKKIDELTAAVEAQKEASPELVAIAQALDDIVPDAPPEEPTPA